MYNKNTSNIEKISIMLKVPKDKFYKYARRENLNTNSETLLTLWSAIKEEKDRETVIRLMFILADR